MANIATITNNIISALSGTTSQVLLGNATLTDFKLDSLTDVNVPTPGDGDVLKWNSATSLWEASDSAGITGSGVAGQVAYFTGATTQAGSNNLFWDNTNGRLGVNTNSPTNSLHVVGTALISGATSIVGNLTNTNSNFQALGSTSYGASTWGISIGNGSSSANYYKANNQYFQLGNGTDTLNINSAGNVGVGTTTPTTIAGYTTFAVNNATNGGNIDLMTNGTRVASWNNTATETYFGTRTSTPLIITTNAIEVAKFYANGNFRVGAAGADSGQRLQVTGDTLLKGSGATSATTALTVQNSAAATMMSISNDAATTILNITGSTASAFQVNQTTANRSAYFATASTGVEFGCGTAITNYQFINGAGFGLIRLNTAPIPTTGGNLLEVPRAGVPFQPTSGTATFTTLSMQPTINQTGGANGITRGLYVNPTLTAAADWRSIEWSNNTGWGLYGAGTAANFISGNLGIGSTTINGVGKILSIYNPLGNDVQIRLQGTISGQTSTDGGLISLGSDNSMYFYNYENAPIIFGTNNSLIARFTQLGNLNIGTFVSDSGEKLQVNGTAKITGDLGVGTASPQSRFHIKQSGNGFANGFKIEKSSTDTQTYSLVIGGDNKLYLGYATTSAGAPTTLLSVTSDNKLLVNSGVDAGSFNLQVTGNSYISGNTLIGSSTDSGQRLQVTGTALITGAVTFGTLALGTGLYWDNTNNRLGIGHSAPATQLHVRNQTGSIITLESTNAGFTATPVETSINFNGYGANLQAQISSQDKQANLAGGWLLFRVKDASNALQDRLIIDRSGFVGIGTTAPAYRLDVQTSGISTPFRLFQANYQSLTVDYPATFTTQINMGLLGRIEYDGNGGMMTISNRSTQAGSSSMGFVMGTTERMRITDTGNVGIGITTPATKLEVFDSVTTQLRVRMSGQADMRIIADTGYGAISNDSNMPLVLRTNATERMRIDATGNVGIGTATPTAKLDVVGTTNISSTLLVGGITTLTNLAGTGTRIVVADASGILSTQATSTYLTSLSGEATNSGSAVTLTNSAVIGKVLTGLNVYSAAIAATDSILAAFGKIQGQIDGLQGGTIYKGSWNANTNTPEITSGTGTQGNYYVVTTAGTTTIDGVSSWAIGDWIIFNGTIWEKIPNVDAITSVNGQTGVVSLTTANISEVTNLYYTDARARAAISLTTSGSSGASTYSSGVLNIPTYTLAGLGGVATGTTITINGTAQDLSASRTFNVGTVTSIVAGTYLTGGTITGSGTIAVDATTTNTASKIVARDSSGNFSAGIVTSIGVNSGNFYDGVGSYNVNLGSGGSEGRGLVAGYSGGAYGGIGYNVRHDSTVTYIAPLSDTSSYLSFTSGGFIFYGAPSGTVGRTLSYSTLGSFSAAGTFNAVNITVNGNQTLHAANWNSYAPSLTGTGASGSWGISVTGNAGTVGGLSVHTDRNNEVNKIVRTDANGYIQAGWINTTSGDNGTTAIDRIYASSDAYLRYYTPANFRTVLDVPTRTGGSASGTWGISVTGNAATATTATNQSGGTVNATTAIITPNVTGVSTGLSVVNGDITTYRSGGTTGVIYLSSSGTKYLYWDAANYNLPGGGLAVGGNISASNFSGSSSGTNTGDQTNISGNAATATNVAYSGLTGTVPIWNQNTTGNAATATSATNALRIVFNDGPRNLSDRLPNSFTRTVNFDFTFAGAVGGTGNYAGVMSFSPWIGDTASTGDSSYQLGFMNESGVNGAGLPGLRIRKGIDTTWGDWYTLLHAGNYNSYSPTLTGTGASGTWAINITGSAAVASISSQVTINYNNNTDSSYQMLWGAGNSVYGTAGITCNPFTDTVNLTGTINSAGIGVVGFGRMYGGDFWHSGIANNGTRTPTLKLGRFSDAELPAYTIYTDDTSGDILEFLSERYTADFRLTRNSDTGVRNAVRMASDNNGSFIDLYNGGGSAVNSRITTTGDSYLMGGNVGIGISSPLYKLDVSGNVRFAGELLMTDTETSVSEGSQTARFQKTYSSSSNISNLNLYSTASVVVFDLTNSTYSGNETYNATALLAQAVIIGNSGTVSSQPMRAIMTGVVGQNGSATMNIADYRHFEVKQPDRANLTGHVIQNIYGLKIAPLKAASGYNITNGWGVYQEGVSDNNHFSGKVLIGTTSVGGSPLRLSGLPTSSAGLSAGDVWNSGGTLRIV